MKLRDKLLHALARVLPPEQVLTNPVELLTYEMDASFDAHPPDAVVFPSNVDDVVKLVQCANEHGMPLVARGAGSGLSGGAVAERGGIIVEFARMNRIVELNQAGRRAVVEPGVVNLALDEAAAAQGLYFPPDPSSGRVATLGGNIAENAGGPHCFKYGVTSNYVTGLQVVLADGRVGHFGGAALDYPEYDFVGVMTGSEGTLGIITQATVRLIRPAPAIKTLMVSFDSLQDAGSAVSAIIARGLIPATLELMDRQIMRIIEDYSHAGLPTEAAAALIVEADGYPESLTPQMDEITAILEQHRGHNLRLAQTAEERDKLWYARKSVGGALARMAPAYLPVDGTVPRSKIAETLAAITEACERLNLPVAYILHAGDGNFHPHILLHNPNDKEQVARGFEAARQVMDLCAKQGGSITGEHGVGIEKRNGMLLMYSPDELAMMRDVKAVFDPKELLNPGKIFPSENSKWELVSGNSESPITNCQLPIPTGRYTVSALEDAAAALRAWTTANPPRSIRIRGGGTKSSLLPATDVILDTSALAGIRHYAPQDMYVTAGAGTPLPRLQEKLRQDGMWVPIVSPWAESTVGGIVASNWNAPLRMRYGSLRDLVLAVTVVLPDGRVVRAGRPVVKNVAGYDVTKLFVGSHGTLGLIEDVTFKVMPLPRAQTSLAIPVENLARGFELGSRLLHLSLVGSALLLCRGCDIDGITTPYALLYTVEGLAQDVEVELALVCEALVSEEICRRSISGSEQWATWLRQVSRKKITLRVGAAVQDLGSLLTDILQTSPDTAFLADIANGQLYVSGHLEVQAIRTRAQQRGGYAVVLNAPPGIETDIWGHNSDTLNLMHRLKERWNPRDWLNPGTF